MHDDQHPLRRLGEDTGEDSGEGCATTSTRAEGGVRTAVWIETGKHARRPELVLRGCPHEVLSLPAEVPSLGALFTGLPGSPTRRRSTTSPGAARACDQCALEMHFATLPSTFLCRPACLPRYACAR